MKMGIVEEQKQKETSSDASKMLEAALQQMDGIISGKSSLYYSPQPKSVSPSLSRQSVLCPLIHPISVVSTHISHQSDSLVFA